MLLERIMYSKNEAGVFGKSVVRPDSQMRKAFGVMYFFYGDHASSRKILDRSIRKCRH